MERFDFVISMLEEALNTKKKRHIVGGILMSTSLLFAGLAVTVITLKTKEDENEEDYY